MLWVKCLPCRRSGTSPGQITPRCAVCLHSFSFYGTNTQKGAKFAEVYRDLVPNQPDEN